MNFLKLPKDARFSNKTIVLFLIPIFIEQLMIAVLSMADTFMVSGFGEAAVAGVSLASNIDKFVKQLFLGIAAGGSVVLSQYIGAKNQSGANRALKTSLYAIFILTVVTSVILFIFRRPVLSLLFGAVEKDVMDNALVYFATTLLSYPFMTLQATASASYRGMGNSKICLFGSVILMVISILLKYIFIFLLDMGVVGAALSNLFAYAIVASWLIFELHNVHGKAYIERLFHPEIRLDMVGRIFRVGIPNGIENGMFQFGLILLQSLVATLGTSPIAAYSLASNTTPFIYTFNQAFQLGILPFVAQPMGAGKPEESTFYFKHFLKLQYTVSTINIIIVSILMPTIISFYHMPADTAALALKCSNIYAAFAVIFYPVTFTSAYALRGVGDTKFTMIISILSMFGIRIGLSYISVLVFKMGVIGTWIAMGLEWVIKGPIFTLRFMKGKWRNNRIIERE